MSQSEARQLAEPVLRAMTDALDANFWTEPWTEPEVTLDDTRIGGPCGYTVQVSGLVDSDRGWETAPVEAQSSRWNELTELIVQTAKDNGYPNMRPSAIGGPGNLWADVAEDDTMLEIFLEGPEARLTVQVPIAADQCKDE